MDRWRARRDHRVDDGQPLCKAMLVVAVMAGVQQIDNHFITPQVMQRAVSLHPSAVMLALLAGGAIGGFVGLLLAVPVAAALRIIGSHIWRHRVLGEPMAEPNRVRAECVGVASAPPDSPWHRLVVRRASAVSSEHPHGQHRPRRARRPTVAAVAHRDVLRRTWCDLRCGCDAVAPTRPRRTGRSACVDHRDRGERVDGGDGLARGDDVSASRARAPDTLDVRRSAVLLAVVRGD